MDYRKCTGCKTLKPICDFRANKYHKTELNKQCTRCIDRKREYHIKNNYLKGYDRPGRPTAIKETIEI